MYFIKRLLLNLYVRIHPIFTYISIALFNTEQELLKADPNDLNEKNKINQKKLHRNPVINKMEQGQKDEKYVKDYYEILKKADKFMKTATPYKMAGVADRFGMNLGLKDQYGRRYDHVGFYDPKSKYYGKTLGDILKLQEEERRLKDDDYELLKIFDNKPIVKGIAKDDGIIEATSGNTNVGFKMLNEYEKTKVTKFPLKVVRESGDTLNKIEQITEFLHIKKIGFEHRLFEFFIPKKFKLNEYFDDKGTIDELCDIQEIWFDDEYGEYCGYRVDEFVKTHTTETYDIIKLKGVEIIKMN